MRVDTPPKFLFPVDTNTKPEMVEIDSLSVKCYCAFHLFNPETLQLPSEVPLVTHIQLIPSTAEF